MTITKDLQFSVLTAPLAAFDRRALSQAWYSALYRGSRPPEPARGACRSAVSAQGAADGVNRPQPRSQHSAPIARIAAQEHRQEAASRSAAIERRQPRSPLARKIERAFLQPRTAQRKASFTVEGAHGRVHVLLRSGGTRLRLVAVCPPRAGRQVAAALAQARYALALRGIDVDAQMRCGEPC